MRTTATRLCLVVSLVAAVALASVPVANAAQRGFNLKGATAHHRDDAQNKKIKKANKNAKRAHRRIAALKEWNQSLNDWNQSQETTLRSLESTVGAIVAGVPDIINGLTTIQSVLEDQVGPGLLALEAGLLSLADFVTADEYGMVQVTHSASATDTTLASQTPVAGCFYQTPNIPDNVQGAYLHGECLMTGVAAGRFIHLMAGVRSNENDGTPSRGPVAGAGIVAYDQRAPTGAQAGGGATGPNAGVGGIPPGAPLVGIPSRSQMTNTSETSFPFGPVSTDNFVDLTQDATFTGAPADPQQAGAGNVIHFTVRFVDLSANADATGE